MVVKRCPHCDQTLPVACKSCPCGHIFISKSKASLPPPPQNQEETESNDSIASMNTIREKRQRAKRENPDFEYCFANVNSLGEPIPMTKRQRNLSSSTDPGYEVMQGEIRQGSSSQTLSQELQDIIGSGEVSERKKKRGRPKGSKNKPKPSGIVKLPSASPGSQTTPSKENMHNKHASGRSVDHDKKKRGRPKGSKNKPKSILSSPIKRGDESPSPPPSSSYMNQSSRPVIEDVVPVVTREKAAAYSLILGDLNQKMQSQSAFTEQQL